MHIAHISERILYTAIIKNSMLHLYWHFVRQVCTYL